MAISGSTALYSCWRIAVYSLNFFTNAGDSSLFIAINAVASLGIAFSLPPPVISDTHISHSLCIPVSSEPNTLIALACCLCISTPECPPWSPPTVISYTVCTFFDDASLLPSSISHCALTPPAQLTKSTPSVSESIFISLLAVISLVSSACAPSMPISSSLVSTAWIGGCSIVSDASIASIYATAIPSSPPSVVPSAHTLSPSVHKSILSSSIFLWQSALFSHTISICPWSISGSLSS